MGRYGRSKHASVSLLYTASAISTHLYSSQLPLCRVASTKNNNERQLVGVRASLLIGGCERVEPRVSLKSAWGSGLGVGYDWLLKIGTCDVTR